MVTKSELKYIEDELNAYLKLKYPDATFVQTCDYEEFGDDDGVSIEWLGDSGVNNIDQAIGHLQSYINRKFSEKYCGRMLKMQFWDDVQFMEKFPHMKAIYGWTSFLDLYRLDTEDNPTTQQDKADELRGQSNV